MRPIWQRAIKAKAGLFRRREQEYRARASDVLRDRGGMHTPQVISLFDLATTCEQTADTLELIECEILAAMEIER